MQEEQEKIDPINEHIQTIANLHKQTEQRLSPQQRVIERTTYFLGQPRFLFLILLILLLWVGANMLLGLSGTPAFDPPPFNWFQGLLTLGAVIQATVILITQNRQNQVSERRRQLDLQVSLLLDEKMSKLITMVDELRRDHPDLENKQDQHVEALKKTVDPHQSLETLDQLLSEEQR